MSEGKSGTRCLLRSTFVFIMFGNVRIRNKMLSIYDHDKHQTPNIARVFIRYGMYSPAYTEIPGFYKYSVV